MYSEDCIGLIFASKISVQKTSTKRELIKLEPWVNEGVSDFANFGPSFFFNQGTLLKQHDEQGRVVF